MPAASGFDRRGKASWPMRLVIALLFLTIFASRCFAFGVYAVGYDAKRKQFESFLILNRSSRRPQPENEDAQVLTIFASRCFAFGVYAVGYDAKRKQFESFLMLNRFAEQEAKDIALEAGFEMSCQACRGVEAFSEPPVDRRERIAGLIPLVLIPPQPRYARRRA